MNPAAPVAPALADVELAAAPISGKFVQLVPSYFSAPALLGLSTCATAFVCIPHAAENPTDLF